MKQGSAGQSVLEFAITLPVLAALLMGVADAGFIVSNKAVATQATRAAVRQASLLPGADDQPAPGYDTRRYDGDVVNTVHQALGGGCIPGGNLRAVVKPSIVVFIYQPNALGQLDAGLPIGAYDSCGNPIGGVFLSCDGTRVPTSSNARYELRDRHRDTPNESPIGVMVQYDYRPVFLEAFTMHFCEFSTQLMEPKA